MMQDLKMTYIKYLTYLFCVIYMLQWVVGCHGERPESHTGKYLA